MTCSLILFTTIACMGLLVQSFAGFAGSLFAMPLFALVLPSCFLPLREAVPAYNMVLIVVDLFLVYESRRHIEWRRLRGVLAGGLLGGPVGVLCLKNLPLHWIGAAISIVTLVFAVVFMLNVKVPLTERPRTQLGVGLLSGVLGGSISESGPPVVVYALALGWNKDTFRSTLLAYFTCLSLECNMFYWMNGMVSRNSLLSFGTAVVPALALSTIGIRLKNVVSESVFRRAILIVIVSVSLIGLVRHLGG